MCVVYVCACVCVVCMHVYICIWKSEIDMNVFFYCSPSLLRLGLSVNLMFISQLVCLVNKLWDSLVSLELSEYATKP